MRQTGSPSLGLVETRQIDLTREVQLEGGGRLHRVTVAYETYGRLNARRDNAILVCHALSGGAHAAGWHAGATKPGWWDVMIGPGKAFDTDRYCVISSNVLGSCYGTTGPSSIDPTTGAPYGSTFPVITIGDMVNVQARLIDALGIDSVLGVVGGSMGGMQALQWAATFPDRVRSVVALATTPRHSALQIALDEAARQAVMTDAAWNGGHHYGTPGPRAGLAVARMIGHITYLSDRGLAKKFGRRLQKGEQLGYSLAPDFAVESYLRHQGEAFVERFDANSLIYLSKAMDYFDLPGRYGSLGAAFSDAACPFLCLTFGSDWLYPTHQLREVADAVTANGGDVTFVELESDYGHDAFLLEHQLEEPWVREFLERVQSAVRQDAAIA
jgi:homoserine O-acetyltransferase/O-succinyltransferase